MGWLDRSPYRFGTPFSQDLGPIDPRTGLPVAQPTQQNPYAPPAAPRAPTAQQRTQQPNFGQPYQMGAQPMMPVPDFQMGYIDPSMAAYANQGGGLFDLASSNPADVSMKAYQPQPGDQATGSGQDKSQYALNGMLGNINNQDLLSLGLSLLGNSQNGGDWGQVGRDLQGIQQGAMSREDRAREIERQKTQDEQAAEQFKAWQSEQTAKTGVQQRYDSRLKEMDAALADPSLSPEAKAQMKRERDILGMVGPEGWANFEVAQEERKAQEAAAQGEFQQRKELQNAQIAASAKEGALDRQSRKDLAELEAKLNPRRDPRDTIQYRADVQRVTPWINAADQARTYTLGRVDRMKQIINELAKRGGVNDPLNSDFRIEMSRLTGNAAENQALLEEYNNLATGFTLDEVQKLKPASNLDFEVIRKTLPNPNNNPRASLAMLNRMEREMNAGIKTADAMAKWLDDGYPLNGKNAEGKTIREVYGLDPSAAPISPPVDESWAKLPPVADFKEGEVIVDDYGQRMKRQGSQWIPVGKRPTAALKRTSILGSE